MDVPELENFRLVGGTALSLQIGHRLSIDIDLFTDEKYGSVDFESIDSRLNSIFESVDHSIGVNPGFGKSYTISNTPEDRTSFVKLDIYYSNDPFMQAAVIQDDIRLATVEEIIAMKIDVVDRGGRKKDFWDLHAISANYSVAHMISLHKDRYQWTHDEKTIKSNFTNFESADEDPDPICLRGNEWVFIKEDLEDLYRESYG